MRCCKQESKKHKTLAKTPKPKAEISTGGVGGETQEETRYDCTEDIRAHIRRVGDLIAQCVTALLIAAIEHDNDKLTEPQKSTYDVITPKLKGLKYGTKAYKDTLKEIAPIAELHYKNSRHHPEHFCGGVNGMTLIDLVEMLCDWKAATAKHPDGDINRSIDIGTVRFGISNQLAAILKNTVDYMGWNGDNLQSQPSKTESSQ